MPELPEVEVLVRHLRPVLVNRTVREVTVSRSRILAPTSPEEFTAAVRGSTFVGLERRGKYLVFTLRKGRGKPWQMLGHLGMTGRMYVARAETVLPKHTAAVLGLGSRKLVFEDTRYFGRLTLNISALDRLGPEPLGLEFTAAKLESALKGSRQPLKVKLLDQRVLVGLGNIYACEALFRAGISPLQEANAVKGQTAKRLWRAIRQVLREAIRFGSTVPLDFAGEGARDGLFYFGSSQPTRSFSERLRAYDREGLPCPVCRGGIRRVWQAGRSTYYCPICQPLPSAPKSKNL